MKLEDQVRAEAGPLREVPSGPLTPGPGPDGLPLVLWRVVTAYARDIGEVRHQPAIFEVEADAVYHIEAELDQGAGLTSVHRLDLYPGYVDPDGPGRARPAYTWRELTYVPPARGRLVVKPS